MGDASGMYASPTGARPQNGGAGQGQGNNEGFNASFQLDDGDQHLESAGGRTGGMGAGASTSPPPPHANSYGWIRREVVRTIFVRFIENERPGPDPTSYPPLEIGGSVHKNYTRKV